MCVCQGRSNFRDCYYVYTGPCECSLAVQTNNMASVFSGWVYVCYLQKHFLCLLLLCSFQFPAKRYCTNKLPRPPVFNWWRQWVPPTETREEMNILFWHVWWPGHQLRPPFQQLLASFLSLRGLRSFLEKRATDVFVDSVRLLLTTHPRNPSGEEESLTIMEMDGIMFDAWSFDS